jgi:capsular exopolysaccharide synthesis family protein
VAPQAGYGYPAGPGAYGEGGYGYGYGGQEADGLGQSILKFLRLLRERVWYIVIIFLAIFLGTTFWTMRETKLYEASSSVRIFRREAAAMKVQQVVESEVRSAEDLNTEVKMLESAALVQDVAARLTLAERQELIAPYLPKDPEARESELKVSSEELVLRRLLKDRTIVPQRLSLVIFIKFQHPSPALAARIANLFADEFINANSKLRVEDATRAGEDLTRRAEDQRKKVTELANQLQKYREQNNMVSLDQRKDIVTERLKAISVNLTQLTPKHEEAKARLAELKAARTAGVDLSIVPYVGNDASVRRLKEEVGKLEVERVKLLERYLPGHPRVQELEKSLTQTRSQLAQVIEAAVKGFESEYAAVLVSFTQTQQALQAQEALSLELDRAAVAYAAVEREYKIAEQLLQNLISRIGEIAMTSAMQSQNARIVDRAKPPTRSIYPNVPLNIALGGFAGIVLGFMVALVVAQLDDRVRSAADIEDYIGLQLVGVVPQTRKMDPDERAQIVVNHKDRIAAEAFVGLHAGLSLREDFSKRKVLSITSTVPGEGKSFVSSCLAATFASRGEKVVLVDCDLRKPSQHRLQQVKNQMGLINLCEGKASSLDVCVVKGANQGIDVIPSGGRSSHAGQMLSSKAFGQVVLDLRQRYDRIILDTPPLGVVNDALLTLPHADASLYVIQFAKVKRELVRACVARMSDSHAPCLGAVMNGLSGSRGSYYYSANYYNADYAKYRSYYGEDAKDKES